MINLTRITHIMPRSAPSLVVGIPPGGRDRPVPQDASAVAGWQVRQMGPADDLRALMSSQSGSEIIHRLLRQAAHGDVRSSTSSPGGQLGHRLREPLHPTALPRCLGAQLARHPRQGGSASLCRVALRSCAIQHSAVDWRDAWPDLKTWCANARLRPMSDYNFCTAFFAMKYSPYCHPLE
jgi:hypothetical protein